MHAHFHPCKIYPHDAVDKFANDSKIKLKYWTLMIFSFVSLVCYDKVVHRYSRNITLKNVVL